MTVVRDLEAPGRGLRRQLAAAEEAERRRLSRKLHDQLGQDLTAFQLGLDDALRLALAHTEREVTLVDRLMRLRALAGRMSGDARYLALELRPPELDDVGLAAALETYVREWSVRHQIEAEFAGSTLGAGRRRSLPADVESTLYRIAQESLSNVARHASAKHVSVVVEVANGEARLLVEDDGCGFDVEATAARRRVDRALGLAAMRERASDVGGRIQVESRLGRGTTIYVRLPVDSIIGH